MKFNTYSTRECWPPMSFTHTNQRRCNNWSYGIRKVDKLPRYRIGLSQGPRIALLRSTASISFQAIDLCGCSFTNDCAMNRLWIISNTAFCGQMSTRWHYCGPPYATRQINFSDTSYFPAFLVAKQICGCNVMELQQFVVILQGYRSLLLRYGATAVCFYVTELQ